MPSDRTPQHLGIREINPVIYRGNYCAGITFIGDDKQGQLVYPRDVVRGVLTIDAPTVVLRGGDPLSQNQYSVAQVMSYLRNECSKTLAVETTGNRFNGRMYSIVKYWTLKPQIEGFNEDIIKRYFYFSSLWMQRKRVEMNIDIEGFEDFRFADHLMSNVMGESKIQVYFVRKCHTAIFAEGWKKYQDTFTRYPRLTLVE